MSTEDGKPVSTVEVSSTEAGQKLLQFLVRRLGIPTQALHRWIRTGQIRINGKRSKAFDRLKEGDHVRLPPFARQKALHDAGLHVCSFDLPVLFENRHIMALDKPVGLPVHAGTGHTDSLAARLHASFSSSPFLPTPAHRLDKATSGVIVVAKSYHALRILHEAFAAREGIRKIYLAWATGEIVADEPILMQDRLVKTEDGCGREKMALAHGTKGVLASMKVRSIRRTGNASLLEVTLHTGRTHQIRAQLALRGHPLVGDVKYGGPKCGQGLLLHAGELAFSQSLVQALELPFPEIVCTPPWSGEWATKV